MPTTRRGRSTSATIVASAMIFGSAAFRSVRSCAATTPPIPTSGRIPKANASVPVASGEPLTEGTNMLQAVESATAHMSWHTDRPRRTIEPVGVIFGDDDHLLNAMTLDDGDTVDLSGFCYPHIEARVAFVLGDALPGEDCTEHHFVNATDYVKPTIVLSDSIFQQRDIGIAQSARIVLGWQQRSLEDINISDITVVLYSGYRCREVEMMRGNSRATHDDPIAAAVRLARSAARFGIRLQAGDTISPGSWTRAVDVGVGDRFRAEFGGLGEVSVEFCGGGAELTMAAAE